MTVIHQLTMTVRNLLLRSFGDEIVEDGLSTSDEENFSNEENFSSDVPFTVPFNSITFEEFPVIPTTDPDNWGSVDLENVT